MSDCGKNLKTKPQGCFGAKNHDGTLQELIKAYIKYNRKNKNDELEQYSACYTIEETINKIGICRNIHGKVYSHQCRVGEAKMKEFADILKPYAQELSIATTFQQIYDILRVPVKNTHQIGDLAHYDVALRISAYCRCLPEEVFVQAGSEQGAKTWGMNIKNGKVDLNQFPKILTEQLKPHEIEDFLCIYQNDLENLKK